MTMAAHEPVVSGHRYTVTLVDGRRPTGLADCVGERVLTMVGNGLSHRVAGTGMEHTGRVRFHQKDLGPDGKDVRVWTISDPGGGSPLLAEHCTAAEPSCELLGFPANTSTARVPDPPSAVTDHGMWQGLVDLSGTFWSIYLTAGGVSRP